MANERVQVDPSEINIGDLIEVVAQGNSSEDTSWGNWYRGVVTIATTDQLMIGAHSFMHRYNTNFNRKFYRLPKPAPVEPKGLGAVVEVEMADDTDSPYTIVRTFGGNWLFDYGDSYFWKDAIDGATSVTVKSDGYTVGS